VVCLTWWYSGNASLSVDQRFLVVSNLSTGFDVYDVETGRLRRMFHCEIGVKSKRTCLPVIFIRGGEFILGGSSFGESPIFHLGSILPSAVYYLDHQGIVPSIDPSSFLRLCCREKYRYIPCCESYNCSGSGCNRLTHHFVQQYNNHLSPISLIACGTAGRVDGDIIEVWEAYDDKPGEPDSTTKYVHIPCFIELQLELIENTSDVVSS